MKKFNFFRSQWFSALSIAASHEPYSSLVYEQMFGICVNLKINFVYILAVHM